MIDQVRQRLRVQPTAHERRQRRQRRQRGSGRCGAIFGSRLCRERRGSGQPIELVQRGGAAEEDMERVVARVLAQRKMITCEGGLCVCEQRPHILGEHDERDQPRGSVAAERRQQLLRPMQSEKIELGCNVARIPLADGARGRQRDNVHVHTDRGDDRQLRKGAGRAPQQRQRALGEGAARRDGDGEARRRGEVATPRVGEEDSPQQRGQHRRRTEHRGAHVDEPRPQLGDSRDEKVGHLDELQRGHRGSLGDAATEQQRVVVGAHRADVSRAIQQAQRGPEHDARAHRRNAAGILRGRRERAGGESEKKRAEERHVEECAPCAEDVPRGLLERARCQAEPQRREERVAVLGPSMVPKP
eukprot:910649-Prymnesium_polylepis.1